MCFLSHIIFLTPIWENHFQLQLLHFRIPTTPQRQNKKQCWYTLEKLTHIITNVQNTNSKRCTNCSGEETKKHLTFITSYLCLHVSLNPSCRREDSGLLVYKEHLPVSQVAVGDTNRPGSLAKLTVGPLRCQGDSKCYVMHTVFTVLWACQCKYKQPCVPNFSSGQLGKRNQIECNRVQNEELLIARALHINMQIAQFRHLGTVIDINL